MYIYAHDNMMTPLALGVALLNQGAPAVLRGSFANANLRIDQTSPTWNNLGSAGLTWIVHKNALD